MMELKGTYTAMITPFVSGEVDYDGLRTNIKYQMEGGVTGILALGTTAETPTLSDREKEEIVKIVVELAKGKVNIMVGTGSNSTASTIRATEKAKRMGADMALIVTPYYNKPTQDGIFLHFKAVTDAVDLPVVVYNIKGRTGTNIETRTLTRIAGLRNIIGVKEASGDVGQMTDVINQIQNRSENFSVMSGDDALVLPLMSLGGKGVISVVGNLVPKMVVDLVDAASKGNYSRARDLAFKQLPLIRAAFIETNPIPIKESMNMVNMAAGECRLPLSPITPGTRELLGGVLKELGLLS
ncbi:MAG: 4-hydroxy-tetrahydrodipicolinate synthase [Candidatus Thermoplasmatota archaeon]|nr:4-hydroxy-tetrahydrodipicolinate synthase [Candidatus Thermoplasmatota archaeon]